MHCAAFLSSLPVLTPGMELLGIVFTTSMGNKADPCFGWERGGTRSSGMPGAERLSPRTGSSRFCWWQCPSPLSIGSPHTRCPAWQPPRRAFSHSDPPGASLLLFGTSLGKMERRALCLPSAGTLPHSQHSLPPAPLPRIPGPSVWSWTGLAASSRVPHPNLGFMPLFPMHFQGVALTPSPQRQRCCRCFSSLLCLQL